jgi:hypothetical protein
MQVRYVDDDVVESLDLQKEVWRPHGWLASAVSSVVPSTVPSAGGATEVQAQAEAQAKVEVQAKAEVQAKVEAQAKAEAPTERLTEQLKLEREVARAHDESMAILGSSHDETMSRIDDGRLVEEPTTFPTVTLKFEGETHRHGR